jgi:hypothetical protein
MFALALKIGDLLATEHERGSYQSRLNSDRDTYMWLDSYRVAADVPASRQTKSATHKSAGGRTW